MVAPIIAILVAFVLPGLIVGGLLMYFASPPVDLTLCEACGYNLQHSPGRTCPECDTARRRMQYRGMFTLGAVMCATLLAISLLVIGLLVMDM